MENLIYLLKVGTIYAILYLVYYIFFRKNTNFQANRTYLLSIIPIAFILPFINNNVSVAEQYQIMLPAFEVGLTNTTQTTFNWIETIPYLYFFIAGFLLIRLVINLTKTLFIINSLKKGNEKEIQPFSFFSFVYVSEKIDAENRKAIVLHEEVHSKQLHSLDIVIYEISKVLLWWNPLIWMGLNSVKSNHEFIADKLASVKADKYSSVLVAQLLGVNCSVLANNFNYKPLIKKRIMMMKTKESNKLSILKYALVVPVIALAIVATANKNESINPAQQIVQQGDEKIYEKVDVMPEFKGGTEALMKYLGSNINYPEEAKKNNIEGKVFVSFVIDKKGNITNVEPIKMGNGLLEKEALRVIKTMPKWKPGEKDGKKVSVKYTIPINFKLNN
jgi:TonB family protein